MFPLKGKKILLTEVVYDFNIVILLLFVIQFIHLFIPELLLSFFLFSMPSEGCMKCRKY